MIVYFDTSALVASYVETASSTKALKARRDSRVATSLITYAETLGVLAVLVRTGALTRSLGAKLEGQFLADWKAIHRVKLEPRLLPEVRRLIATHSLKGADAIHLASAGLLARACNDAGIEVQFASDDRQLAKAAKSAGMVLAW
jgi:uncharacterized protein